MTLPEPPLPEFGQLVSALGAEPVTAQELITMPPGFSSSIYRRGSLAMRAAVEAAQKKFGSSRLAVWVPDYFCNDALHPVRELNVECVFYSLNADLTVDWEAASRIYETNKKPAVFILVHYFGFPNQTKEARKFCDDRSMVLMEDAAHCLIVSTFMGLGDFMIFSPRKLLPSPLGGVLATRSESFNSEPAPNDAAAGAELTQWLCRRMIQKTLNTVHIPWHFAASYQNPPANEAPGNGAGREARGCDPYVRKLLGVLISDREQILRKRRAHYEILQKCVEQARHAAPVFRELPDSVCPYVFPVRMAVDAAKVVSSFRKDGIPASRWPDLPPEALADPSLHRVAIETYEHVILLPIHQSLTTRDVERIGAHLLHHFS